MNLGVLTARRIVSAGTCAALIFAGAGIVLPSASSALTPASVSADRKPSTPSSNSNANSNANSNGNSSDSSVSGSVANTDKKPDKGRDNGNTGSASNGNTGSASNGNNGSGSSESAKPDKPANANSSNGSSNGNANNDSNKPQKPDSASNANNSNGNSSNGNNSNANSSNSNSNAASNSAAANRKVPSQALQSARVNTAPEEGEEITACLSDLPKRLAKNVARKNISKNQPVVPSSPTNEQDLDCADTGVATAYIVQFAPGANRASEVAKAREAKMKVTHVFTNVFNGMTVWATPGQLVRLQKNPNFTLVEPDGAVASVETVQQPVTWGLDRVDQRPLPLTGTYTYGTNAAGVQAYVIDTGIRTDHADFAGRVGAGYTSIFDGNGVNDCNGHGTHVAGTIGGTTYGVAKGVTLRPVRVLDCTGSGTWSGVIAGLDWVAGVHQSGTPAVANMSLGGGASTSVDTAVRNLISRGVSVVVAAGNSNTDACTASPARVSEAITVGSTTNSDARSSFSNYGSCLDIFAPGSSITSTWNTSPTAAATLSGTSMASPHVAGAVALALATEPTLSTGAVASRVTTNATPSVVTDAGAGSPNLLLYTQPTTTTPEEPQPPQEPTAVVPDAPAAPSAIGGVKSATVSWSAPTSDGGSAITGYTIRAIELQKNGRTRVAGEVTTGAGQLAVAITGLKPGARFVFTVAATNAVGTGAASPTSNVVSVSR